MNWERIRGFYAPKCQRLRATTSPQRGRSCSALLRFRVLGEQETSSSPKERRRSKFACYVCQEVIPRAWRHVRAENRDLKDPIDSCIAARASTPHEQHRSVRETAAKIVVCAACGKYESHHHSQCGRCFVPNRGWLRAAQSLPSVSAICRTARIPPRCTAPSRFRFDLPCKSDRVGNYV